MSSTSCRVAGDIEKKTVASVSKVVSAVGYFTVKTPPSQL